MKEVLKQALEALKDVGVLTNREWQAVHKNKANELRQAIAELESQEPWCMKMNGCTAKCEDCPDYVPPAQPAQEPWPDLTKRDRESYRKGHDAGVAHHKQAVKAALAQPVQERNFCSRCGKRTADLTTIHTCTPPQEKNNG